MARAILASLAVFMMLLVAVIPSEASLLRPWVKIKNVMYQMRGVDSPHSVQKFTSWPGYTSFVHSNCWHIHGEMKVLDSAGREIRGSSKSIAVPVYCKGLGKFVSRAFSEASEVLKTPVKGFLLNPALGFTINPEFFTHTCGLRDLLNQNCRWSAVKAM